MSPWAPSAKAASAYWDLNSTTTGAGTLPVGIWDNANLFWNAASDGTGVLSAWSAGDVAVFSAGTDAVSAYSLTVSGTQSIGGLTFEEGFVTLNGGTLSLAANSDFNVAGALTATVNSVVDGTFRLNKTGTGTLVLGGVNTYSGGTTITAGTLSISQDANLGTAPGSPVADSLIFAGGTLQVTGSTPFTLNANRGITINPGVTGTVRIVDAANTVTYAGAITGAAGTTFTKTGAGTLELQANNDTTFLGALNLDGGTLKLSANGTLAGTSGVTIGNRGTLTLDNGTTNLGNRSAGAIASNGGTINFLGNSAATTETLGALTLNAGALTINSTAGAGGATLTIPSITRNAGGTLYVNGTGLGGGTNQVVLTTANGLTSNILPWVVVSNGTVTRFATHGGNGTSLAPFTGSYSTAESAWTVNTVNALVSSNQALAGNRIVYSLTLDAGFNITATTSDRSLTIGSGGVGAVLQTGGTSTIGQTGTIDNVLAFGANEAVFHILGTLQTIRADSTAGLTGTAGLTKAGVGTLILGGQSTLTGTYRINEGILEVRRADSLGASQAIHLNGGTLRISADAATTLSGTLTLNYDSTIQVDRVTAAATATTHTVGALTMAAGRVLTVNSSDITSGTAYGLTTGNVTLNGAATFDVANNGVGIGTLTVGTITAGGNRLTKLGAGDLVTSSTGAAGFGAPLVEIQAGRIGWSAASGTINEATVFTGAGGIIKSGSSILNLTAVNSFTGSVTAAGGTLGFTTVSDNGGAASNLGQGTDGLILGGGVLQFNGAVDQSTNRAISITVSSTLNASGTGGAKISYTNTGTISAAGNTLTLDGTGEGIFNGSLTQTGGAADINKNGAGTWTINAAQNTTDDIIVNGGTLILNAVNVHAGDDLFIRTGGTVKLGLNGTLSAASMDDLLISDSGTTGGSSLDINGKTSSVNDVTIGLNPSNQPTAPAISGSIVDTLGGGLLTAAAVNLRSGTISANLSASGIVSLGNVFSNDAGGSNVTTGTISGSLGLLTGGSLVLYSGTISGPVTFAAGTTLTKHSTNTVTLSGNNTTAGAGLSTLNAGTLVLNYATNSGSKIGNGGLTVSGGTLQLNGHATTDVVENVGNLTVGVAADPGATTIAINPAGANVTLQVGTITRNAGGTLRFNPASSLGHLTTTASNQAGTILGGWATYRQGSGATNFATISGGEVIGLTSTVSDSVAAWATGADITDSTGFSGSRDRANINSLRFDAASGASLVTINAGGFLNIGSGGILVTSNVAAGTPKITGGFLTGGTPNEIIVTQDAAVPFTIASEMAGSTALTKSGNGVLVLDQTRNRFNGTVRVNSGTLRLQGGGAIGDTAPVILDPSGNSVLEVVDSETIGSLSGGDINNFRGMAINIAASKTLTINQSTSLGYFGNISASSGSATLTKNGAGTLTLNDSVVNLGAAGVINVNAGRLTLDINGNNGQLVQITAGTTVNLNTGGAMSIVRTGVSQGGIAAGTIADDVAFNLNSTGSSSDAVFFSYDQDNGQAEVVGLMTFASGVNSVRIDSGSGTAGANAVLRASTVARTNQATLVIRGNNIHKSSGFPRSQFSVLAAFAGVGTGTGVSQPVIPWAVAPAAGGTTAPDSFVTTSGGASAQWRPLATTEYAAVIDAATWGSLLTAGTENVRVTGTVTGGASKAIRTLVVVAGTATVDVSGSGVLTLEAGGVLFSGSGAGNSTISGFSGLAAGAAVNEYIFHTYSPTATVSVPLTTATAKLTVSGTGTLILSGNNTGVGATSITTLNEGTLQISDLDNIGGDLGGLVFAGGTLKLAAGFTDDVSTRTINLLIGGGTLDTNNNTVSFANAFSGVGAFTKAGLGTLTLNASSSHTGGTIVSGGTLALGINQGIGTGDLTMNGGTFDMKGFTAAVANLNLANVTGNLVTSTVGSPALTVNGTATVNQGTIGVILSGAMDLVKATTGQTVILSATNSNYTGVTYVDAGTLSVAALADAGTASSIGAATGTNAAIRLGNGTNAGTLLYTGGASSSNRPLYLFGSTGGGVIDNDGTGVLTLTGGAVGYAPGAKALTLQGAAGTLATPNVFSGLIEDGAATLGVTKAEAGVWSMTNANTYTGPTTITAGTLVAGNNQAFGTGVITLNAGTLAGDGTARTFANDVSLANSSTIGGSSDLWDPLESTCRHASLSIL